MRTFVCAGLVAAALASASGETGLSPMWNLEVRCLHPEAVTIETPAGDQAFWYVIYSIKNPFADPREIRPAVMLTDNFGRIYQDAYKPEIIRLAKERVHAELIDATVRPLTLSAGRTIQGVAIFPMPNPETSFLSLYVHGAAMKRIEERAGQKGLASRAFKISYYINGDQYNFTPNRLELQWAGFVNTFRGLDNKIAEEPLVMPVIGTEPAAGDEDAKKPADETKTPPGKEPAKTEEAEENEGAEEAPAEE